MVLTKASNSIYQTPRIVYIVLILILLYFIFGSPDWFGAELHSHASHFNPSSIPLGDVLDDLTLDTEQCRSHFPELTIELDKLAKNTRPFEVEKLAGHVNGYVQGTISHGKVRIS
jgi:hypothetical protein